MMGRPGIPTPTSSTCRRQKPALTQLRPYAEAIGLKGDRPVRDAGQGSIFIIAVVALAFVLTAFFVDVSRSLNAHGASLEVAAQAARAAADQVTQESLRTGDPTALRIDPAAAESAGQAWLAEAGATGTVRVLDGGTAVRVSARVPCTATLLAAFGYRDLSKPATAEATLLYGTAGSDGQPITYRGDLSVRPGWSIFDSSSSEVLPERPETVIVAAAMAASVLDRRQGGVR